jgi:GNAT superfamily N-acetyltransferase
VTDFVVPEELRGKGIGGKMLDEIFGIYGPETISAAASSVPSVKAFYKRGLRPGGNPNATLDDAIKIMKEDSSVTMVKPLPPTADEYIKAINPTGTRIPSSERPNLGMGDMYGMLPKEAQKVAEKEYPQFGKVKYMSSNGDVYAVGFNPDVGEEDVLGYAMSRGDGTELALANELQGLGIGSDLSYLYRSKNPFAPSGGLTEAGEKAARKAYKRMMGNE